MALYNKKSKHERREHGIEIMLTIDERKKLDGICKQAEITISELVRETVLSLSAERIKAIKNGNFVTTSHGRNDKRASG